MVSTQVLCFNRNMYKGLLRIGVSFKAYEIRGFVKGDRHVRENLHICRLGFIYIFIIAKKELNRFKRNPNKRRNIKMMCKCKCRWKCILIAELNARAQHQA